MNCPSRVDADIGDGWNQSPNQLAGDLTTRSDLGRLASARVQRDHKLKTQDDANVDSISLPTQPEPGKLPSDIGLDNEKHSVPPPESCQQTVDESRPPWRPWLQPFQRMRQVLWKFAKFIGPGFMIAVAYIDPGNYATDAAAGASFRFRLLFVVLVSNIFAVVLQSLCIRLSTITGLNLAEMNRKHCPPWLNYALWFFGESAVIATDIAEVIGFAIALNLLAPQVPIVAGCVISVVDVFFILLFYRPHNGSMALLRAFEGFVILLVVGVAICFCYQLSLIRDTTVGEVFSGYLPSKALVEGQGLYQACGILGATVMPHSLYLGSGLNQPRLRQFDAKASRRRGSNEDLDDAASDEGSSYRPSLAAINSCMKYSIWELVLSLFTFALFINSAILILCGASLYGVTGADNSTLFGIYDLLHQQVGPPAASVFAVALLLSGISAGVVCTMAGQMISEGQIKWKTKPWITRLMTRSISIVPAIIVAGAIGKQGLSAALVGSQVALSVILPIVSAPLIYYTSRNKYMTVETDSETVSPLRTEQTGEARSGVPMRNHWIVTALGGLIWVIIVVMNVANIVLTASGVS